MAKEPGFKNVKAELTRWWNTMKVTRQKDTIESVAQRLYSRKKQYYDPIEKQIGVPWYMVAVIDQRESGATGGVLHNGEKIVGTGRKTQLVPAGRGPFSTWHNAAIDALTMPGKSFHKVKKEDWSIELILYALESYNGWGYRQYHPRTPSPYIWSCTNIYDDSPRGKYVADGKWGEGVTDKQIGCAPIIKRLLELDKAGKPTITETAVVGTIAAAGTVAATAASPTWILPWVIGGIVGLAVAVGIVTWIIEKRKKDELVELANKTQ